MNLLDFIYGWMFFTGMFEKLGVEAKIFKVGKFKSAVEPFFRKDMSEPNRLQVTSFLNSIYDHYLEEVSKSRGIEIAQLELISDSMLVRTAADAVKFGLVNKTAYSDEVEAILKQKSGIAKDEDLSFVSYDKYARSFSTKENSTKNRIAVIIAEGEIVSGKSSNGSMGSAGVWSGLDIAGIPYGQVRRCPRPHAHLRGDRQRRQQPRGRHARILQRPHQGNAVPRPRCPSGSQGIDPRLRHDRRP